MASPLPPASITCRHHTKIFYLSPLKNPLHQVNLFASSNYSKGISLRSNAFFGSNIQDDFLEATLNLDNSLSQFPVIKSGFYQVQRVTGEFTEMERWVFAFFAGLTWIYLTARPGVLLGAIDAYVLAPLQMGLASLSGRKSLKISDFVVGNKLGEGSFGVVYAGAIVPNNAPVEDRRRKAVRAPQIDDRYKQKVILKKVNFAVSVVVAFC